MEKNGTGGHDRNKRSTGIKSVYIRPINSRENGFIKELGNPIKSAVALSIVRRWYSQFQLGGGWQRPDTPLGSNDCSVGENVVLDVL